MRVVSLASGSKGNSYFIETEKSKILVDAGICYKDLSMKLEKLKINTNDIDAIFITHEHIDHIKGLENFIKFNPNTKIFIHNNGVNAVNDRLKGGLRNANVFYDNNFSFKDLGVNSFKVSHDSKYCCGYSFFNNGSKVSIATDLGFCPNSVLTNILGSNLVYLEANHDVNKLLNNLKYPPVLKQRILSDKGHLSNDASEKIIENLALSNTQQVVLSHLSEENNSPSFAYHYIKDKLQQSGIVEGENIFIDVATQNNIGTIFNIK